MSTDHVVPLSDAVQTALRIPVVLIGLVGMVLALVLVRRNGALSAVFGALGGALLAADQAVNIWWVLALSNSTASPDDFATETNMFTIADVVLITLAGAALVVAFAARKAAGPPRPAFAGPTPGFPPQPVGFPPQPVGFPPPPPQAAPFPPPGQPAPFPAPPQAGPFLPPPAPPQ